MVTTETKRLVQLMACLIKLHVASCAIKLLVLNNVRLSIAEIAEHVIIEKEAALVHTLFPLPLATHANHRLKFPELVHRFFLKWFSIVVQMINMRRLV